MIDIVIPIYNLRLRGYERLKWLLYSLSIQETKSLNSIYIVIGSNQDEFVRIKSIVSALPYKGVFIIHNPLREYCKPKLLNRGITASCLHSRADRIACVDVDNIFSPDFFSYASGRENCLLLHKIQAMPKNAPISEEIIREWQFPDYPDFPHGEFSCGAIQMAPKEWWQKVGGYDERLKGMGCEDVDIVLRAKRDELPVIWQFEGIILHQYHPPLPMRNFANNRDIVDNDPTIIRNQK